MKILDVKEFGSLKAGDTVEVTTLTGDALHFQARVVTPPNGNSRIWVQPLTVYIGPSTFDKSSLVPVSRGEVGI